MSLEMRKWVCDNLTFTDDSQRQDLMTFDTANPDYPASGTSTMLIAFLVEMLHARNGVWQGGKLEVTAVRSDHPTDDGPDGHFGGNAIDLAQTGPDDALEHIIKDAQACENALGIGLGGPYQAYADACGGYGASSKLFEDNNTNHIHIQVVGY